MTDDRSRWMVLLYEDENAWATATPEQQEVYLDRHRDYEQNAAGHGVAILSSDALQPTAHATTLRAGEERIASDGPFAETTEQLGGFYLVEAASRGDVVDHARRLPPSYTIEVRPVAIIDF
ncbi:YciI family protein [Cellulomonas fimi]|uniref:YciI family protein n=1 Tax=Cellulomonas fimi TaxID=1708 RepID=UPI00234C44B9|nr:YciI family protein [Cellulomonas fimi]MDC7123779.1 YciI family protein [Cellulomonas fimi]